MEPETLQVSIRKFAFKHSLFILAKHTNPSTGPVDLKVDIVFWTNTKGRIGWWLFFDIPCYPRPESQSESNNYNSDT